jgi:hypothetical protein
MMDKVQKHNSFNSERDFLYLLHGAGYIFEKLIVT